MEGDYNFWADMLDTFESSSDWIKALWLLIPPGFALALIAMVMRFRLVSHLTNWLQRQVCSCSLATHEGAS